MDLNIQADDIQISTNRNPGQIRCYLSGVYESDLLSTENFQAIPIMKWGGGRMGCRKRTRCYQRKLS